MIDFFLRSAGRVERAGHQLPTGQREDCQKTVRSGQLAFHYKNIDFSELTAFLLKQLFEVQNLFKGL
jgi:hypothetical protein